MSGSATAGTTPERPDPTEDREQEQASADSVAASRRLLRGFGATALYPIVTAIVQILTVPIFLRCWGSTLYGEWLILITIPQYMALSDMGFGSVAGNEMTMRVAANDRDGALRSFQSAWMMICIISAVLGVLASGAVLLLPLQQWLHLATMQPNKLHCVMLLLIFYSLVTLQSTLAASGFRCDGNYALGAVLLNVLRLGEALGMAAIVALGAGPLKAAVFMVTVRVIGQMGLCLVLRRRSPWITWGMGHVSGEAIRKMVHPATAFMAFPLGQAMSIQGMLLVIGIALGPVSVTMFSTLRTLTRIGVMIVEVVRQSIWPELSTAFGGGNLDYARKLHGKGCQAAMILCGGTTLLLMLFGHRIYAFWTHNELAYNPVLFRILLVVVLANCLWYASSAVSLACNAHQKIAGVLLISTMLSLLAAYLLMPRLGLLAPALALIAVEVVMVPYVLRSSLSILHQSFSDFLEDLFAPPDLRGWIRKIRNRPC